MMGCGHLEVCFLVTGVNIIRENIYGVSDINLGNLFRRKTHRVAIEKNSGNPDPYSRCASTMLHYCFKVQLIMIQTKLKPMQVLPPSKVCVPQNP